MIWGYAAEHHWVVRVETIAFCINGGTESLSRASSSFNCYKDVVMNPKRHNKCTQTSMMIAKYI